MKRITVLGSTGSIGKSTLDLLTQHKDRFKVVALTAKSRIEDLYAQCVTHRPVYAVVDSEAQAKVLRAKFKDVGLDTQVLSGAKSLEEVAALPEVDYVMAAIVGAAGLLSTLAAAKAGKRILLANKESLVMSGALLMETVAQQGATLLPVDSEHNAIFQCMPAGYLTGSRPQGVEKIILTASGGPFRTLPFSQFEALTPQQAVSHPTWDMGAKISVDSATMMNKGFEVIETYWLYQMPLAQIEVVIHPQSMIHSLVYYQDGSILAQLGAPDMRIPIAYTLSWPERISAAVKRLDLIEVGQLTFEPVDSHRFPCLELAYAALKAGGTASALLNAANEVAVAAFLDKRISYPAIYEINVRILEQLPVERASSAEEILEADRRARELAMEIMPVIS